MLKEDALKRNIPIIKDDSLNLILNYIKDNNYKDILELGTAIGYSSIEMAKLDKDIIIDTIEKNNLLYNEALFNIEDNNLTKQINAYNTLIEEFHTEKLYDLIFVDAAKAQYKKYLEQFIDNLKSNGVMIFDNMIFHGLIHKVDEIKSKNLRNMVKKINDFRDYVQNNKRFDIILHDNIGDGILVLSRRKSGT